MQFSKFREKDLLYDLVLVHGMEFLLFHAFILQLLILKRVKRSMCGMKER